MQLTDCSFSRFLSAIGLRRHWSRSRGTSLEATRTVATGRSSAMVREAPMTNIAKPTAPSGVPAKALLSWGSLQLFELRDELGD